MNAKISTLADTFDVDDPAKWAVVGGSVVTFDGRGVVDPMVSGYMNTVNAYDATNSRVYVQILEVPTGLDMECWFYLESSDLGHSVYFYVWQDVSGIKLDIGIGGGVEIPYDPILHRWWQFREDAGTLYFETSQDGVIWIPRFIGATPSWDLTQAKIQFGCDTWQTTTGAFGEFVFDNLNIPRQPPVVRRVPTSVAPFISYANSVAPKGN